MIPCPNHSDHHHCGDLKPHPRGHLSRPNIKDRTRQQNAEIERREVVVQEELAGHDEEGEVVHKPSHREEGTDLVVFDDES